MSNDMNKVGRGKGRLSSLDVLRGLTVFGMVLVNNGVGRQQFSTLQHSTWNGLTPCDLVFPFFLYMVGVSIYLSLRGKGFTPSGPIVMRIIRRSCVLFAIGVFLHVFDGMLHLMGMPSVDSAGVLSVELNVQLLQNLRVWGVLQRIALCYCIASLMTLYVNVRSLWKWALVLLVIYSGVLILGNGYAQDESNWACQLDRVFFDETHLYRKSPVDPEGLLGTISALAHTLLGVTAGWLLLGNRNKENDEAMSDGKQENSLPSLQPLLLFAVAIGIIGYLLQFGLPLNKRIWSPSYVLVTCSIASGLLALLTYIIDYAGKSRWAVPFRHLGMNAFFIYVLSEALAPVFEKINLPETVFGTFDRLLHSSEWSSAAYAISFSILVTLVACLMGWRRWYVKI